MTLDEDIKSGVEKTLNIMKIKNATITITPSIISIENISKEQAQKIKSVFNKAGMKTLEITDLKEIEMGEGFEISIVI